MKDRSSWTVKDEAIFEDLAVLMQLTDEDKTFLAQAQPHAQAVAPKMVDAFYGRLTTHSHTAEFLDGMVDHLRTTLEKWFLELFGGKYGVDYVKGRLEIGKTHVRIGLPVRYPLAMMDLVMQFGEDVANQTEDPQATIVAFRKVAALDIAVFNQAYESTQLAHLAEMVGNERLARRMLTE